MIVYHGSNVTVDAPDVLRSQRNLDFGKGFYVTTALSFIESYEVEA